MNLKEEILLNLKGTRKDRLDAYLNEEKEEDVDTLIERAYVASFDARGVPRDAKTLAKQYAERHLQGAVAEGGDRTDAVKAGIRKIVMGVKSTFLGGKAKTQENLADAVIKNPELGVYLGLNIDQAKGLANRMKKQGAKTDQYYEMALKGLPSLVVKYDQFQEALKDLAADQDWISGLRVNKQARANADVGNKIEGRNSKSGRGGNMDYSKLKFKASVDDKTEGDQGNIGKNLKEEAGSEGDGGEAFTGKKKKASCDTSKKASVETDEKNAKKVWNSQKERKYFNY